MTTIRIKRSTLKLDPVCTQVNKCKPGLYKSLDGLYLYVTESSDGDLGFICLDTLSFRSFKIAEEKCGAIDWLWVTSVDYPITIDLTP